MKKYLTLIIAVVLFSGVSFSQSADQVPPTYSEAEKLLDATIICLDAVEAPTKHNEFAKQFINTPSFQKEISDWLVINSFLIDKILIERKKSHDITYGPRPY